MYEEGWASWRVIYIYLGDPPSFTGWNTANWESTGNFVGNTDQRFQLGWLGGWYITDYAEALTEAGDYRVYYIYLDVDGGFTSDQVVLVDNVAINNFKLGAHAPGF